MGKASNWYTLIHMYRGEIISESAPYVIKVFPHIGYMRVSPIRSKSNRRGDSFPVKRATELADYIQPATHASYFIMNLRAVNVR